MSFETTHRGNQWTHSASIKGGRRDVVKKGAYIIDHRDSGRFIMGSSNDVSKDVDKHLKLLTSGKHPNRFFQNLHDQEINRDEKGKTKVATFVVIEYPLKNDKDIKKTLKEIRETNTAPYCLIN